MIIDFHACIHHRHRSHRFQFKNNSGVVQDNNAGMTNDESSAAVAAATPGGQLLGAQETAGLNFPNKSKLNFQMHIPLTGRRGKQTFKHGWQLGSLNCFKGIVIEGGPATCFIDSRLQIYI